MKPENLNNFSQKPRGSVEDSTTENNSLSSDSDIEDISCANGDQRRIVQGLRKTIRKDKTKINDLVAKLTIAESNLANEKEKSNYKDDLIKLTNETKDLSVKQLQSKILELENELALSKSTGLIKEKEKISEYENNLREKDKQIEKLEYELTESKAKIVKLESTIHEKDEELVEWNRKTQKWKAELESFVLLNCTAIPSNKLVSLPELSLSPFAAVFAGSWMVIQQRIDGSVSFDPSKNSYKDGFGDLGTEFWLGLEKLHKLTTSEKYELYIVLVDFDDVRTFARYDQFVVGSSEEKYKLISLGDYSGNAGDALRSYIDCAFWNRWWYLEKNECYLNGTYKKSKDKLDDWTGVWWGRWNMGNRYSLKSCKMLIRPKHEKSIELNLGPKHLET